MLYALLMLTSTAAALEGQTGQWLPSASRLQPRQGWLSAGAAWDWSGPGGSGDGLLVRGVVGLGHRTALNAEGHINLGDPIADLGLGFRTIVLSSDGFRLAPFGHVTFMGDESLGRLGLAGHLTGAKLDVDAALSLVQITLNQGDDRGEFLLPPSAMTSFDLGVSLAPAANQELRIGALGREQFWLTLGYRWLGDAWLVQADLLWWPYNTGARITAGVRF